MAEKTIRFTCGKCGKRLKVRAKHVGENLKCPRCDTGVVVPEKSTISSATVPVDAKDEQPLRFSREESTDEGLDMTPMVDVTFLLLIFFMLTASFSLHKSLEVPPQDTQNAASQQRTLEELEEDDDYVIVEIDEDNAIWLDQSEIPTFLELLSRLRQARETPKGSTARGPSSMLVLANPGAYHETVVQVLDAGSAAGMESVRLGTATDF